MSSNVTHLHDDASVPLKDLRAGLQPDERKLVSEMVDWFEREAIDTIGEVRAGIRASGKQASVTATAAVKKMRGGALVLDLSARVRAPRPPKRIAVHLKGDGDQLQLALGEDPNLQDDD